jgi:hypothetical protein
VPSLGNLPPNIYKYIEESYRGEVRFPAGMLIPGAPYSGRRYFALAYALAKVADVKFYGPGYPDYRENWLPTYNEMINVEDVIARLYPRDYPDAVIQLSPTNPEGLFGSWVNFEKARCLRVLWAADFHNDVSHPGVPELLKANTWDLVVKSWDVKNVTEYSRLVQATGVPMEWLPFSVDPEVFKDYGLPKVYDVINMGTFASSHYPLRQAIHNILNPRRESIKYVCGYDFVTPTNQIAGVLTDEYARIINQGKMYTTCTSSFKYFGLKLLEIMACNTLLVCDTPLDAEELGFKAGINYVEIDCAMWHFDPLRVGGSKLDEGKFLNLVNHYLSHPEDAARIARNGYELVHSRHTNEIRAKEFLSILSRHLK